VHDMPATSSRHQLQGQAQSSNPPVRAFYRTYRSIPKDPAKDLGCIEGSSKIDTLTSACAQKSG
jgi:hypothetical protein